MTTATADQTKEVADEVLDAASAKTELVALNPLLQVKAGLAGLAAEAQTFDVTTAAGEKAARAFRAKCVSLRTSLDDAYEQVNRPLLNTQRAARGLLADIKAEVLKLEKPADDAIKAIEALKERLRQERLEKEAARIAAIRQRIVELFTEPLLTAGSSSADLRALVIRIEATGVDESFEDLKVEAQSAKVGALARLDALVIAADKREQEAADLARQRAELEAQRQRDAAERAAQKKKDDEERAEQKRIDAAAAAERKAAQDAAEARLHEQREAFEREQAVAREEAAARQRAQNAKDAKEQREREAREAEERRQREEREAAEARARAAVIEAQARLERSAPAMLATLQVVRTSLPDGVLIPGTPRLLSDLVDETIAEAISTTESTQ